MPARHTDVPVTQQGISFAPDYFTSCQTDFHSRVRQPTRHSSHSHFIDARAYKEAFAQRFKHALAFAYVRIPWFLANMFRGVTLSFHVSRTQLTRTHAHARTKPVSSLFDASIFSAPAIDLSPKIFVSSVRDADSRPIPGTLITRRVADYMTI